MTKHDSTPPDAIANQLPLYTWATRFRSGQLFLKGHAPAPIDLPVGRHVLSLAPGPVDAEVHFEGGDTPLVRYVRIEGDLAHESRPSRVLTFGDQVHLDDAALTTPVGLCGTATMQALLAALGDLSVVAEVVPDGQLMVRFGFGVSVVVENVDTVRVEGATQGPAHRLQLSRPLEVDCASCNVRVSHEKLRFLSRLANVRIAKVRVHPDGSVDLVEGAATGRLVRGGLRKASEQLSDLVRRSPKLRPFLS